jgi:hypothetical protein
MEEAVQACTAELRGV